MHSLRLIGGVLLYVMLQPLPAGAVWEYSLAAQLAMHDGLRATCEKIEPRLSSMLNDEWSQIIQFNKIKTINAARQTREYKDVYRQVFHEYLKHSWNDAEEAAHVCEALYAQHNSKAAPAHQWWHDRSCTGVSMDSEDDNYCAVRPGASVYFGNTMLDKSISILRITPSSDVSFPHAGTFVGKSDLPDSIVSNAFISGTWAIPDFIEFEWKEWPSAFPIKSSSDIELDKLRRYADEVRAKVERKHAKIEVRNLIPNDVIAKVLQSEQTAVSEGLPERRMKLIFIFMQEGLRFRWEQWRGRCIEKYGGDNIDFPRDRLLSGASVCDELEPTLHEN